MSPRRAELGFTLVETLLAVFSLALLMSAGGALLLSTLESSRVVDSRLERLNELEIATAHLRADLMEAVARQTRSARATDEGKSFFGGFPDRDGIVLGLVRSGWLNIENEADRSELLVVDYRYIDDKLIRRVHQAPDRTRSTPAYETVLMDGLTALEVRFEAGGVSSSKWELVIEEDLPVLPDAVTLEMSFSNGQRLSQSFLVAGAI